MGFRVHFNGHRFRVCMLMLSLRRPFKYHVLTVGKNEFTIRCYRRTRRSADVMVIETVWFKKKRNYRPTRRLMWQNEIFLSFGNCIGNKTYCMWKYLVIGVNSSIHIVPSRFTRSEIYRLEEKIKFCFFFQYSRG